MRVWKNLNADRYIVSRFNLEHKKGESVEKLKAGIIGCGFITKLRHIPAFKKMEKTVDLCAVCDINENLVKETAKEFHIAKAYTSTSTMFSEEDLDIVDICVPPQIHAPIAIESMENGCNVITEKPMALKVSDCDQMIDASQKQGVKMCVIHNIICHRPFLEAREIVAHGAYWEVRWHANILVYSKMGCDGHKRSLAT